TPPREAGYALACTPSYRVGLTEPPECSGQTNEADTMISLYFSNVYIEQEVGFTLAIQVVNPGAAPQPDPETGLSGNAFGIVVRDKEGNTIDANMMVEGMDLLNIPLVGFALAWDSVEAQSVSKLQVVLKITRNMNPGEVLELQIEAPQDVAFAAPSSVVLPENLPASDVAPVSVAGNRLIIRLNRESETQTLVGTTQVNGLREGTVLISFAVKNPSQLPNSNYWILKMFGEDRGLVFQHVFEGYQYGQQSSVPYTATGPSGPSADSTSPISYYIKVLSTVEILLCMILTTH
ncbi:hypothetical protein FOL47_001509, partial [Perkinsus chesapeaki]